MRSEVGSQKSEERFFSYFRPHTSDFRFLYIALILNINQRSLMPFNLRSFKKIMLSNRSAFRRFLTKLENKPPRGLDQLATRTDVEVWKEMDCLACANCCKTMSPTFTLTDIKRISRHLGMKEDAFKKKWLRKDSQGDWINVQQPCQFLNLKDNKCSIYEVRPRDCAGFPHHTKRHMTEYMHVFKQNVEYCPATYKLVEKMMHKIKGQ